jgi:AcrR family transcriptional regulator
MSATERRARQKEALRNDILEAARQLFAQNGYDAVSMRQIADAIEYSVATIYLHFSDKRDLYNCLCREAIGELGNLLEPVFLGEQDPLERLERGLRDYINFGLENPQQYRVAFVIEGPNNQDDDTRVEGTAARRVYSGLVALVEEAIAKGEIAAGAPEVLAQTIWAGVHGLTSLLIMDPGFPWQEREALVDSLIRTIVGGLKAPG